MSQQVRGIEIEIGAQTLQFDNAVDASKHALSLLRKESNDLKRELKFNPDSIKDLERHTKNAKQQMMLLDKETAEMKRELATADGKQLLRLQKRINHNERSMRQLGKEINQSERRLKDLGDDKSLLRLQKQADNLKDELELVNRELKMDPKHIDNVKRKTLLLNEKFDNTVDLLQAIQREQEQADNKDFNKYQAQILDVKEELYDFIDGLDKTQREAILTEDKLTDMAKAFGISVAQLKDNIRDVDRELNKLDTTELSKLSRSSEEFNINLNQLESQLKVVDKKLQFNPNSIELLNIKSSNLDNTLEEVTAELIRLENNMDNLTGDEATKATAKYHQLKIKQIELINQQTNLNRTLSNSSREFTSFKNIANDEINQVIDEVKDLENTLNTIDVKDPNLVNQYKDKLRELDALFKKEFDNISNNTIDFDNSNEEIKKLVNNISTIESKFNDIAYSSKTKIGLITESLQDLDNKSNQINSTLLTVDKRLQLNPDGMELVELKANLLNEALEGTYKKASVLKTAMQDASEADMSKLASELANVESETIDLIREIKNISDSTGVVINSFEHLSRESKDKFNDMIKDSQRLTDTFKNSKFDANLLKDAQESWSESIDKMEDEYSNLLLEIAQAPVNSNLRKALENDLNAITPVITHMKSKLYELDGLELTPRASLEQAIKDIESEEKLLQAKVKSMSNKLKLSPNSDSFNNTQIKNYEKLVDNLTDKISKLKDKQDMVNDSHTWNELQVEIIQATDAIDDFENEIKLLKGQEITPELKIDEMVKSVRSLKDVLKSELYLIGKELELDLENDDLLKKQKELTKESAKAIKEEIDLLNKSLKLKSDGLEADQIKIKLNELKMELHDVNAEADSLNNQHINLKFNTKIDDIKSARDVINSELDLIKQAFDENNKKLEIRPNSTSLKAIKEDSINKQKELLKSLEQSISEEMDAIKNKINSTDDTIELNNLQSTLNGLQRELNETKQATQSLNSVQPLSKLAGNYKNSLDAALHELEMFDAELDGPPKSKSVLKDRQKLLDNAIDAQKRKIDELLSKQTNVDNQLDFDNYQSEINQANKDLKELEKSQDSMRKSMKESKKDNKADMGQSVGDIAAGNFVADAAFEGLDLLGEGFLTIAEEAINTSDEITKFENTLGAMGKSKEDIKKLSKEMVDFAAKTPYALEDVTNATAVLASNNVKDFDKVVKASASLNSAYGGTAETYKSVSSVLSQTAGEGKLSYENWKQLTENLPGATGALKKQIAENMNIPIEDFKENLSKGKISAEQLNKAVMDIGNKKENLKSLTEVKTFGEGFDNLIASLAALGNEIIKTFGKKTLIQFMTDLIAKVDSLKPKVQDFFKYMQDNQYWIQPLIAGLSGLAVAIIAIFASLSIVSGIMAAVAAWPITLAAVVIGLLAAFNATPQGGQVITTTINTIKNTINTFMEWFNALKEKISINSLFSKSQDTKMQMFDTIKQSIDSFKTSFDNSISSISSSFEPFLNIFSQDLKVNSLEYLSNLFSEMSNKFTSATNTMVDAITPFIDIVANKLMGVLTDFVNFINSLLLPVYDALKAVTKSLIDNSLSVLYTLIDNIANVFSKLQPIMQAIADVVLTVLQKAFNGLYLVLGPIIKALLAMVQGLIPPLLALLKNVANFLINVLGAALSWLIETVGQPVIALVTKLKDAFLTFSDALYTKVYPYYKKAMDFITESFLKFGPNLESMYNKIKPILSSIVGFLASLFNYFKPKKSKGKNEEDSILKPLFEPLMIFWELIKPKVTKIKESIAGFFKTITNLFKPKKKKKKKNEKSFLEDMFSFIKDNKFVQSIMKFINELVKKFKPLQKLITGLINLKTKIGKFIFIVKRLIAVFFKGKQGRKVVFEYLKKQFLKFVDKIKEKLSPKSIKNLISKITSKVFELFIGIGDKINSVFSGIWTKITETLGISKFTSFFGKIVKEIIDAFANIGTEIGSMFGDVYDKIESFLFNRFDIVQGLGYEGLGQKIIGSIRQGIENALYTISQAASQVYDRLKAAVLPENVINLGKDMINAVKDGFVSGAKSFGDTILGIFEKLFNIINNYLRDVSNPRTWLDLFAMWSDVFTPRPDDPNNIEVTGITNSMSKAISQAKSFSNIMSNAFNQSLNIPSNINNIGNSNQLSKISKNMGLNKDFVVNTSGSNSNATTNLNIHVTANSADANDIARQVERQIIRSLNMN